MADSQKARWATANRTAANPPIADKLGIVAGAGGLPRRLVETCRQTGREVFVLALEGAAEPETVIDVAHAWCPLGAAGRGLALLRDNGVGELVLAGGVRRPALASLRPDWRAAKFFARVGYRALGDDGLLSAVVAELEREGFRVIGPDQVLQAPLAPEGPLGGIRPDEQALADIARGERAARALGALDIGQAVVVQQGLVLGVEAIEGTDALLRRCAGLRREGPGGVLVKVEKPGQEQRADRPTIGPQTVTLAVAAGLCGIAVEAGATIVLDRDEVVAAADRAGLFVFGIRRV
ncbi:MAG: UDP-2,3-diacylglucosamine diphosphatase LpxI [Stellaceae bacterium]